MGRHDKPVGARIGRSFIPGGHAEDGGFSLLEMTPQQRDALGDRIVAARTFMFRRLDAAERLAQIMSQVAAYGTNAVLTHELRQAEDVYDATTRDAAEALGELPEERV
jgi:hypothetical protein